MKLARRRRRRRGGRRRRNPGIGLPMVVGAGAGVLATEAVHEYVLPLGDNIFLRAALGGAVGAAAGYFFG